MQSNAAVVREPRASMPESLYRKHTSPSDVILKVLIYAAAVITVLTLVGIIAYILIRGVPYLSWQFLSTPYSETNMEQRGILPMIINTLYMVVISLLISTPIGISSAIYLTQYARQGRLVKTIRFTTEILSGVPSIIFGLFGYTVFCILFRLGTSILAGALTMTICILPTIVRTTEAVSYTHLNTMIRKRRSSPRPVRRAPSPLPPIWPAVVQILCWAVTRNIWRNPKCAGCSTARS